MFTPEERSTAEPCCSATRFTPTPIAKITNIEANTAQACRRASTIRPNMKTQAAGISRIDSISMKFERPVGFSSGTAELESYQPPPFVPSCLIAICEATGPRAIVCVAPCTVVAVACAWNVCGTPCQISSAATTSERGRST